MHLLLASVLISVSAAWANPAKASKIQFCDSLTVMNVMTQKKTVVTDCYQKQLSKTPALSGKMVVQFWINANGKVNAKDTKVIFSTLKNPEVEQCVARQVNAMTFPKPSKGLCRMRYPFVFKTAP